MGDEGVKMKMYLIVNEYYVLDSSYYTVPDKFRKCCVIKLFHFKENAEEYLKEIRKSNSDGYGFVFGNYKIREMEVE